MQKDPPVDLADIDLPRLHCAERGDGRVEIERQIEVAGEEIGGPERQYGKNLAGTGDRLGEPRGGAVAAGRNDDLGIALTRPFRPLGELHGVVGIDRCFVAMGLKARLQPVRRQPLGQGSPGSRVENDVIPAALHWSC